MTLVTRTACIWLILVFSLCGQSSEDSAAGLPGGVTDEEYTVYSSIISQLMRSPEERPLVIREMTIPTRTGDFDERHESYLRKNFRKAITEQLLQEYRRVNAEPKPLKNKFAESLKVAIMSKVEHDQIFKPTDGGWQRFYSKYGQGASIIELSRVAFDSTVTRGLVYYGCAGDGGKGGIGYYVLVKRNPDKKAPQKWVIEKKVRAWIA